MFVEMRMADRLRLNPQEFEMDNFRAELCEKLQRKYINKVLPELGLCICLNGFDDIGAPEIPAGDGAAHIKVEFRMVVFRPHRDEVMVGRIHHQDETGLLVSLGFFEDVFVPKTELMGNAFYDTEEACWTWQYNKNTALTMHKGQRLRFRVVKTDFLPKDFDFEGVGTIRFLSEIRQPMRVIGSIKSENGLGLIRWWNGAADSDDEQSDNDSDNDSDNNDQDEENDNQDNSSKNEEESRGTPSSSSSSDSDDSEDDDDDGLVM